MAATYGLKFGGVAIYVDDVRAVLDFYNRAFGRFFVTSATIPRWTGYTLGFRLIETYKTGHSGATAAQLVDAPATLFRRNNPARTRAEERP